jgi:heme exporter protein D
MIWNSLSEFWSMGGYGEYVWGSFGVAALFMGIEVAQVGYERKQTLQRLRMLQGVQEHSMDPLE